jgi:hypothetical protein
VCTGRPADGMQKRFGTGDIRSLEMASAHSLAKLIKFIRRTEWQPASAQVREQHLGRACSFHRIDPVQIFDILGEIPAAGSMISARACSSTVRVVPRSSKR